MGLRNSYKGIEEYAARTVQCKARWMVGRAGFTRRDVEDLEQELMLDLLQRLARFDPARAGRRPFISRVVEHCAASLLAAQNRAQRAWTRDAASLDDEAVESERHGCCERRAPLADDADRRPGGPARKSPFVEVDLRLDVEIVVAGLPPELRSLCQRLRTESLTEVARSMGVPRTTLYRQIALLRRRFGEAGLGDFARRVRRSARSAGR